ncbi:MAG: DUF2827 family protein [Actinobacteria bacterium]|nr:DUF2827 family protein [Actinomycetota bacterium]
MRIGITYTASPSIFGGGRGQTSINLAKALETSQKYQIDFIRVAATEKDRVWFDDAAELNNPKIPVESIQTKDYDILIDIDGFLSAEIRTKISKTCIIFYRKSFVINEIENAVYNNIPLPLNFIGADAVWMWKEMNAGEENFLREVIPIPITFIPFLWSPVFIENYLRDKQHCMNSSDEETSEKSKTILHLIDNNYDNQSNSILPLVATSKLLNCEFFVKRKYDFTVRVENGEDLSNNNFFRRNIWNNSVKLHNNESLVEFWTRCRICDWKSIDSSYNHVAISNIRFTSLKHFMLDIAWLGINYVHNSLILADLYPGLSRFYYEECEISQMEKCIHDKL